MPAGRPSAMNAIVGIDTTAADRIVELIRAGNYIETAAAAAGVVKQTVHSWMRTGAHAHAKAARGEPLTEHDEQAQRFLDAVVEAQSISESMDVARLAQLAVGGIEQRTVTIKTDAAGNTIERTEKTERTLPDKAVLMWRLERRFPDRWGRQRLEITGADGEPLSLGERAQTVAAQAAGFLAALEAERQQAALEAEAAARQSEQ